MDDNVENHTLAFLRRLDAKLDQVLKDVSEVRARLGQLETGQAQIQVTLAEHSVRFDRMNERLSRIERRLDMHDPAIPA